MISSRVYDKDTTLVVAPYFLPGINGGGPIISVSNLIQQNPTKHKFIVFSRNHDLGNSLPYEYEPWEPVCVDGINVIYKSPGIRSWFNIISFLTSAQFKTIYLNSFFDPLCIFIFIVARIVSKQSVILIAPRGEFHPGCLQQKYIKKNIYIFLYKRLLATNVCFHATNLEESDHIVKTLVKIDPSKIFTMSNLPNQESLNEKELLTIYKPSQEVLRIVLFSRFSKEKNHEFALKSLNFAQKNIELDIIGPVSPGSRDYYRRCLDSISLLPNNVRVNICGPIANADILRVLPKYDLALYPTFGDNFAHVVADLLRCGVRILISPNTPWRDIEDLGYGKILPIDDPCLWARAIDSEADTSLGDRVVLKKQILNSILRHPFFNQSRSNFIFPLRCFND